MLWTRSDLRDFINTYQRPSHRWLWAIAKWAPFGGTVVGSSDPGPYLLRIYLTPHFKYLPNVYLHHFFRGDDDVELHNHPWKYSMSLILTGGYIEERMNVLTQKKPVTRKMFPGFLNFLRQEEFHRVTLLKDGCWTLFASYFRVRKSDGQDWGFLDVDTGRYTAWGPFCERRTGV